MIIEFDEEYQTKLITVKTHYKNDFIASKDKVIHRVILSEVESQGFLGFLYKRFGKFNIGDGVLKWYKTHVCFNYNLYICLNLN